MARGSFAIRVKQEVRFIRTFARSPRKTGALSPTSRALASLLVANARPDPQGWVLELGPGTGAITRALVDFGIAPERIVSVEYDKHFAALLQERFPRVNVVRGDAFDLARSVAAFDGVAFSAAVSALPLLNFRKAERAPYLEGILDRLAPGGRVSQLSYSLAPPQEAIPGRLAVEKSKWVTFNLPPGRAWIYSRP